jgi:hypothetical protein
MNSIVPPSEAYPISKETLLQCVSTLTSYNYRANVVLHLPASFLSFRTVRPPANFPNLRLLS